LCQELKNQIESDPNFLSAPRNFFLFPTMKKTIERKEICHCRGGENSFAGGT
jgi:hypothetical protein